MKLGRVATYLKQFPFIVAIRFICFEFIRKIFDYYGTSSYSQTGEDRIIAAILGERSGFFVDVGCNHPQHGSNTFELYKKGWHGISIDANHTLIRAHQKLRKQDISICAAVSDKEEDILFTEFHDSFVSSLNTAHVHEWKTTRKIKEERMVSTLPLHELLEHHGAPKVFDLLCIDVEGHDYEVLLSLNINSYRPRMVVVEMHGFDLNYPHLNRVYEYLIENDYKMVGYIVMNGYFVDLHHNT